MMQIVQLQDENEDGSRELLAQREFSDESFSWEEFDEWARDVFKRHDAKRPWVVLEPDDRFFLQGERSDGTKVIGERRHFAPDEAKVLDTEELRKGE